jgi:hypothetical protein
MVAPQQRLRPLGADGQAERRPHLRAQLRLMPFCEFAKQRRAVAEPIALCLEPRAQHAQIVLVAQQAPSALASTRRAFTGPARGRAAVPDGSGGPLPAYAIRGSSRRSDRLRPLASPCGRASSCARSRGAKSSKPRLASGQNDSRSRTARSSSAKAAIRLGSSPSSERASRRPSSARRTPVSLRQSTSSAKRDCSRPQVSSSASAQSVESM